MIKCSKLPKTPQSRMNESLELIQIITSRNPIPHTQTQISMRQLIEHLRADVGKVTEPKAQGAI